MYCSKCGKQLNDDAKFCKHCGQAVVKSNSIEIKQKIEHAEQKQLPNEEKPTTLQYLKANFIKKKYKKILIGFVIGIIISSSIWFYFYNKLNKDYKAEENRANQTLSRNLSLNEELDKTKKDLEIANALSGVSSSFVSFTSDKFDRLDNTFMDMDTLLSDYDAFVRDNCYVYGSITNQYSALTRRYTSIAGQYLQIKQEIDDLLKKINGSENSGATF